MEDNLKTFQSMGGQARAASLTPEQRSAAARHAAEKRWAGKIRAERTVRKPKAKPVTDISTILKIVQAAYNSRLATLRLMATSPSSSVSASDVSARRREADAFCDLLIADLTADPSPEPLPAF